ncbi:hypothetical protein [Tepidibacillus fermentans]|uniref:Uncharacterized protein n=1 Tax=Tepidibacillus fermentans TaxID=1281767 RepID=A0A4R3K614_9BACI|nr:hypothetical protein [Tepidibacillus fermentans]TCS78229.1 hypothetical protein EDD72_1296 [Tepidibacillus fermentans]
MKKKSIRKNNLKIDGEFFAFDLADPSHQNIKIHPDQENPMEPLKKVTEPDEY